MNTIGKLMHIENVLNKLARISPNTVENLITQLKASSDDISMIHYTPWNAYNCDMVLKSGLVIPIIIRQDDYTAQIDMTETLNLVWGRYCPLSLGYHWEG